jgi:hypothetical protein
MGITNTPDGLYSLAYGMAPYSSTMTYHYDFTRLSDRLISGFVQVPLLFGMELKKIPLFWQVGVKAGMGLMGSSKLSGRYSTTIDDKELNSGLSNMYSHTLVTNADLSRQSEKVKFGLNVAASAEVGMNLDQ